MLQGDRVRLRALEPTDVEAIWSWHQDHELHVLDGWLYPASRGQIAEWLHGVGEPGFRDASFGIETEQGTLIGYVRLKRGSAEHRSADFGIAIAREHWDQGYGTDATRTMVRFGFEEMGLHRIELDVSVENPRAQHVYEQCGFRVEGVAREARWRFGQWVDMTQMAVLDREFRESITATA
ncbi:MAG: N-acetyltransferase [Chloroflexi bacterium]|nr:MAG: N-acetyltransferase [Chloroflexota bacterium]